MVNNEMSYNEQQYASIYLIKADGPHYRPFMEKYWKTLKERNLTNITKVHDILRDLYSETMEKVPIKDGIKLPRGIDGSDCPGWHFERAINDYLVRFVNWKDEQYCIGQWTSLYEHETGQQDIFVVAKRIIYTEDPLPVRVWKFVYSVNYVMSEEPTKEVNLPDHPITPGYNYIQEGQEEFDNQFVVVRRVNRRTW